MLVSCGLLGLPVSKTKTDDTRERLIKAALSLAAEDGWRSLSMSGIAGRAAVDLTTCYRVFPDKTSLLVGMLMGNDCTVLADGPADIAQLARDRLFEVLMRRFDALQADRDGNKAIIRQLPADPLSLMLLAPRFRRSMVWMLEVAGLPAHGCFAELHVHGVALIFLSTLRVWMTDESPDLSRTMTALDRALREAEGFMRHFPQREPSNRQSSRTSPDAPAPESSPSPDLL